MHPEFSVSKTYILKCVCVYAPLSGRTCISVQSSNEQLVFIIHFLILPSQYENQVGFLLTPSTFLESLHIGPTVEETGFLTLA